MPQDEEQPASLSHRPKDYRQLSLEEKIERLREVIKSICQSSNELNRAFWAHQDRFNHHVHEPGTNRLLIPLQNNTIGAEVAIGQKPNESDYQYI